MTAELHDDGYVRLDVADDGRWREPRMPSTHQSGTVEPGVNRGYGLAMTAALVDRLIIEDREDGTTVTVTRTASRPAQLLTTHPTAIGRPARRPDEPDTLRIVDHTIDGSHRISVFGPLDASTIGDLGEQLDHLTRGGTRPLTVDLTGVTHLASAAVAELHRSAPGDGGYPLRLYAPAGSTAHHVLSLVNLPHTTTDPHVDEPSVEANG